MTSKVSNKKFSPVLHNFKCGLKSKTKLAIIIGILHLAAAPAVIISGIASIYIKEPGNVVESFMVIGAIATALAGAMGIYLAIDSFNCLHTKSVVDMRLSLPLTARQRFGSNFLSGLVMYLGPFFAAQIVTLLSIAYGLIFMEGKTFTRYAGTDMNGNPHEIEYVCQYFADAMQIFVRLMLTGTLAMLMLYTLTVLVTVCCGSKFESIAYTVLINLAIPFTLYMGGAAMFLDLFGVNISTPLAKLIMYTSPAGGVAAAAEWCAHGIIFGTENMNYALWTVIYLLITAAMGAAAYFLYTKRRAEQVSKPFVFKAFYYVISTAAIFCIYAFLCCEDAGLVPSIIVTAIVYLILEVIANRGFKKVWLSLIKYAGVITASVLIVFAAQKTEGFGMVTRIPDISSVKSVELEYKGFYGIFDLPYDYDGYTRERTKIKFTEKENIETIISAHRKMVDSRETSYDYGAGARNVKIIYKFKNGMTLEREYDRFSAPETELLGRLDLTDEYKTQLAEIYKKYILREKETYLHTLEIDPEYAYSWSVNLNSKVKFDRNVDVSGSVRISNIIDKDFFEQLAEAYAKDIMSINEENYYHADCKDIYYLNMNSSNINIPDNFKNTLELLEYFGCGIHQKEAMSDDELTDYLKNSVRNHRMSIFTAAEWREINCIPDDLPLHGNYDGIKSMTKYEIKDIDKDVLDLYRSAEPMNIVPENGYIINVFGEAMGVPAEMNGTAEKVYAEAAAAENTEYNNETALGMQDTTAVQAVPIGTTAYTVD